MGRARYIAMHKTYTSLGVVVRMRKPGNPSMGVNINGVGCIRGRLAVLESL